MNIVPSARTIAAGLIVCCSLWIAVPAHAQQSPNDATELQQLKADLKRIEQRIDALEQARQNPNPAIAAPLNSTSVSAPVAPVPAATPVQAAAGPEAVKVAEDKGMDTMDAGMGGETIEIPHLPEMKFRGFGDVRAFVANQNLAAVNNTPAPPPPSPRAATAPSPSA